MIVALRRITRAIDLHSRELLQAVGLTAPQLAALRAIARMQPVTVGALARSIHLSQATLTGILTRLEKRRLITRARSGADRRAVDVEITDEGRSVLSTAPSLLHDCFRRELSTLKDWEQNQILATLQRIAAMMDADKIDTSKVLGGDHEALSENLSQFFGGAIDSPDGLASPDPPITFRGRTGRTRSDG
ncbi:MAG: MarR family transcriptional regulator [Pirellulales bacterium]